MKRSLKALGLALGAMLAIGAITAVGAQAELQGMFMGGSIEAGEHESTIVTGTQSAENPVVFTAGGNEVGCTEAFMRAEIPEGTASQFPLAFEYGGVCTAGGFPATVFDNGCHLVLQTSETAPEEGSFTGEADLACPEGVSGVQLKLYSGAQHGFQVCQIEVAPQNGLEGAVVHNLTEAEPRAALEVTLNAELMASQSGLCGASEYTATLEGTATVQGFNEAEEQIDIWIDHKEE